jgi:hypothetical protein
MSFDRAWCTFIASIYTLVLRYAWIMALVLWSVEREVAVKPTCYIIEF